MILSFNARTEHIYRDGAAVGRITRCPGGVRYTPFSFDPEPIEAPSLTKLLAKVRQALEGQK